MQTPPGKQCRHESSTVEGLILSHAVTSTDEQLVCTMAMVCKDWNMAVQSQAPAGRLHVNLQLGKGPNAWHARADAQPSNSMKKLGSFSKWLAKHARLVSRLKVTGEPPITSTNSAWFTTLVAPLFSLALRSAALATTAEAAQRQPLGMQSYSSDIFHDSTVLQALPAASLTHLRLAGSSDAAVAAALPRLSNLQHLDVAGEVWLGTTEHSSICAAASQVSTLTSLILSCVTAEDVTRLPVQLLRLELRLMDSGPVDFSHLTRLSSLNITASANSSFFGQAFPAGLTELGIAGDVGVSSNPSVVDQFNISQLQSLESLAICESRESPEDLRQLGSLPALRNLSLGYIDTLEAIGASPAWASLWQLKDIELYDNGPCTDFMEFLDKLSSVTQLTRLAMFIDLDLGDDEDETVYEVCHQISSLHQLRELTIQVINHSGGEQAWAEGDVSHLSTLTQLTKLQLFIDGFAREAIDDFTVVKLLLKLKQLQELRVPVQSLAVIPVIGDLSNLRTLGLCGVPAEVQRTGLKELQGLKRLTTLEGFDACSKKLLADFWNAVRS